MWEATVCLDLSDEKKRENECVGVAQEWRCLGRAPCVMGCGYFTPPASIDCRGGYRRCLDIHD
jgi:hypothetical protein